MALGDHLHWVMVLFSRWSKAIFPVAAVSIFSVQCLGGSLDTLSLAKRKQPFVLALSCLSGVRLRTMDVGSPPRSCSRSPYRTDIRTRIEPAFCSCSSYDSLHTVIRNPRLRLDFVINGIRVNDGAQYLFFPLSGDTSTFSF
ncbi:hypothetical protein K458DRAFT_186297 [Lentithecium fluviatile CBS 122367]|uniref:Uncharacterized protein n=1 Tax=Lentithecium fluviatile CBS 122367 TaxID=1168545 RepID=A0A6G1JAH3_9PLEO|nr:hypothetical protein K458DRAFT_186297 [Lentithecium fluviatile CBS 122367]